MRDYQKSKVYHAENVVFDKSKPAEFESLDECRDFANRITSSKHWTRYNGWQRYTLRDGRGRRSACYKSAVKGQHGHQICLPKWSRSRWIIIHEFAHFLTKRTHGSGHGHTPSFTGHYLALVAELLGDDIEFMLRSSFDTNGVRYMVL